MEQLLITPERCLGCHSCELACAVEHSEAKDLIGAVLKKEQPVARIFVETDGRSNLPLQCRHCEEPYCVYACMSGAMKKDEETKRVSVDQDRCVGCWMCVMACPFGAIVQDTMQRVINKCDFCPDKKEPACTAACPTGALRLMEVSDFSKEKRQKYLTVFPKNIQGEV
ncbi:MAG: 4Fe-4S dicluster domain-containing protein [Bacillota bacterium]